MAFQNETTIQYLDETKIQGTRETDSPQYNQTASGYGTKIPTSRMIKVEDRWRRIYCTIYSNAGSCWITVNGEKLFIR